jgi:VIT1/CCC1 family predicted Fe2+/Mn2+ transporter
MNTAAVQTPRPSNLKNVMLLAIALGVAEAGIEHYSEPLHGVAGLLGGATSLLMGLLIGLRANSYGSSAVGGLLAGGACAFFGILAAFLLHDQPGMALLSGTIGGICMGVIGGLLGRGIPRSK